MKKTLKDRWHRWGWMLALIAVAAAEATWSSADQQPVEAKTKAKPAPVIHVPKCLVKSLEEAVLAFDRPGILGQVAVKEGDTVEAGQFLATLKDEVPRAALAVAQIQSESEVEIVYSQFAAEVAKTESEMMEDANNRKPGVVPLLEVRRAKLNHSKTLAEVEKARENHKVYGAKRDEAAAQLDTYRLEAPFEGFVTKVNLVRGASVKQGDAIIELVNTRKVRVEGRALAKEASLIRIGCKVEIQLEKPDEVGEAAVARIHTGKITFVDLAKVDRTGVRVVAEADNPDRLLRAGLFATMTIHPDQTAD